MGNFRGSSTAETVDLTKWHKSRFGVVTPLALPLIDGRLEMQDAKNSHLDTIAQLYNFVFAIKACIDNRKKNLSNSNPSSTCPHNMVNFGPLTAEIGSGVWGTPANFNGFRVLAPLLHGTLVVGVSQTLRR